MRRARLPALTVAAVGLLVFCLWNVEVGTDLGNFLPEGSRSELAAISSRLTDSPLTRTMILSVGAPALPEAVAAAGELAESLARDPGIAWVRASLPPGQLEQLYELYFPRRFHFLSDEPEREIPPLLEEEALRAQARELRVRLAAPASTLLSRIAPADPLGAFERILQRVRRHEGGLRIAHGGFVSRDGEHAIVIAATHASPFDSGAQTRLLHDLTATFDALSARRGGALTLEIAGANRFAVAAEQSMRGDVYWVGGFAFLGIAALFFGLVGSLRTFLVASVPPAAGILVALTLGTLVFDGLDGLTVLFGASLMGIAVDYSNHLIVHHGLAPAAETPFRTVRRLRPSLVLGALTTVASFGGLALTAFPAFREISFFATAGVVTGLLVTLYVLPDLVPFTPPLPRRAGAIAARLARGLAALHRAPRALLGAVLAASALALFAFPRLEWMDDMSRLTRFDPELLAEERRVREQVGGLETGRFVVGLADDAASAVVLNDRIAQRLDGAALPARSLHDLLWSPELQRRNLAVLTGIPDLAERVDAAFRAEGFRAGAFRAFQEALASPPPPLTLADLEASPLADLLAPFVFALGDDVAVVTYLQELPDPEAVRERLAGLPRVYVLNQRTFVNDVYREFRQTTLRQMLVGGALVVGLLAIRYRAWRPVVASFLPSAVVAVLVLAALVLLGVRANLLHVMSLILVAGMGVDYGVFLVDGARKGEEAGATMLSLLVSCLTTAFVFGALAFSSQPALRAIGVTTGLGILLSYALAPLTLVAARIEPAAESADAAGARDG